MHDRYGLTFLTSFLDMEFLQTFIGSGPLTVSPDVSSSALGSGRTVVISSRDGRWVGGAGDCWE